MCPLIGKYFEDGGVGKWNGASIDAGDETDPVTMGRYAKKDSVLS